MAGKQFVASVVLNMIDRLTAPLRRITNNFDAFGRGLKRFDGAMKLSANIKQSAEGLEQYSRSARGLLEKPLKTAIEFERVMSEVNANTFNGANTAKSREEGEKLRLQARQLGADTWASANQAAEGMNILAKSFSDGPQKAQQMLDAMPGLLNVAKAGQESIATSADITTATMTQFGLAAKETGRIGDVLVKTANSSTVGLVDMGEALKYSGATAHMAGVDLETTAAMIGALGNAGKRGSTAGTGLASVLGNLQSGAKKQRSALAALGIDITDEKGNFTQVVGLLAQLERAADKKFGKGKGGVRRDRWLQGIVGMGGDKEVLAILMQKAGSGELQKLVDANKGAAGTAARVAAEMANNTAGSIAELDSSLEELSLTMGDEVLPVLRPFIVDVTAAAREFGVWAKEHPGLIKGLTATVGALGTFGIVVAPVLKGVGALVTLWGSAAGSAGVLRTAAVIVVGGLRAIAVAAMTNPIIALIGGIAVASYLIYDNWEWLVGWWEKLWDSLPRGVQSYLRLTTIPIRQSVNAAKWLAANWDTFKNKFIEIWDSIPGPVQTALKVLSAPVTWLITVPPLIEENWEPIETFFTDLWDTIVDKFNKAIEWITSKLSWVGDQLIAFESHLPTWMTGREEGNVDLGGALAASMDPFRGVPALDAARTELEARPAEANMLDDLGGGLRSTFAGELKVTVDTTTGAVTKTEMKQAGTPGFLVQLRTGLQGATT